MRVLAVIPARAGSKGLPGKNIRSLGGKPLIVWSIEHALASNRITDVLVSTDGRDIADVARDAGALVPFLRPADLASDIAATEPVILHALRHMESEGQRYDCVALLQPTSPIRSADMTDRAIALLDERGADSLLSVVPSHAFFWQTNPVRANYDYRNRPRRQDIAPGERHWRETGSLYLTKRDVLTREENRLGGEIALFETVEAESYEIDSPTDFQVAEALIAAHSGDESAP